MKKNYLLFMLLCIAWHAKGQVQSTFQQDKFMIGTYYEPELDASLSTPTNINYVSKLQEIKSAHFNLISGLKKDSYYNNNQLDWILYFISHPSTNLSSLKVLMSPNNFRDPANNNGVTNPDYSISGSSLTWKSFHNDCFKFPGTTYTAICDDNLPYKCTDALYGFHIKDEPTNPVNSTEKENIGKWIKFIKTDYQKKLGFINLSGGDGSTSSSRSAYELFLNTYFNPSNSDYRPDVAAVDVYPFLELKNGDFDDGPNGSNISFSQQYFYNLSTLRKVADIDHTKPSRSIWFFPLSVAHVNPFIEPNQFVVYGENNLTYNHLMYSVFCPMAYGAKGMIYFTYAKPSSNTAWNKAVFYDAILDGNNSPCTQRYENVKNINYFTEKVVGPMIMKSKWLGAFHKSNSTNEDQLTSSGVLATELLTTSNSNLVHNVSDPNILIGLFRTQLPNGLEFTSTDSTEYHVLVVNKSLNATTNKVTIQLKKYWTSAFVSPEIGIPSSPPTSCNLGNFNAGSPYNGVENYTFATGRTYNGGSYTTTYDVGSSPMQGGEARIVRLRYYPKLGNINFPPCTECVSLKSIYPNPVNSILNVEIENTYGTEVLGNTYLIDEFGGHIVTLYSGLLSPNTTYNTSYNVSSLPNGLYYVIVSGSFKRVFVQH